MIEATIGSLVSKETILISKGNEAPQIRWIYLDHQAKAAKSWDDYKRIQLERARVVPERSAPFVELGHRALRDGTLEEATQFFGRAIGVHEMNLETAAPESRKGHEMTLDRLTAI